MLSRRTFLLDGLRVAAVLPVFPTILPSSRRAPDGRSLVVIQLTGGNDGLNTVVPWRQDAYYRARPTLGLASGGLHALDEMHGLHPALAGLGRLYQAGRLSVVQGVGHPGASRSHFESLEVWHRGQLKRPKARAAATGWLGRMADQLLEQTPGCVPAIHVGAETPSPALLGRAVAPLGLVSPDDLILRSPRGVDIEDLKPEHRGEADPDLAYLRAISRSARDTARRLADFDVSTSRAEYPSGDLAHKLHLVARLITGGPGTRLFSLTLAGFDTHARQAVTHSALLEQLSRALEAFEDDLRREGVAERVATMIFSEFGRRVSENGSRGTDHGAAAPVFLLGGPGQGGLLGRAPDLDQLDEGDLPHGVDFRALYSALERDWMQLEASTTMPAFDFGR